MKERITCLVSSSPIKSHPSTDIIEETLESIRYHLPDSKIIVMLDGVRDEQENREDDYLEYTRRLPLLPIFQQKNIVIAPFISFHHQALMTMRTLEAVTSPYILFMEHDTPIVRDFIHWDSLIAALSTGDANHIRLHFDETIHPEHRHLMLGKLTPNLIKTIQWSQRPHLANKKWYEDFLNRVFNENSRTFIEDRIYTFVACAPWEDYRLCVYDPEGQETRMKRSRDLNGRDFEPKYGMVF